jgi:hypothetical protein
MASFVGEIKRCDQGSQQAGMKFLNLGRCDDCTHDFPRALSAHPVPL